MLCLVCGMFKKSGKHYVSFELFFEDIGFLESLLLFAMRPNKSMLSFSAGSNDKFDCPQISRMASYPISAPTPTATGCAWWKNRPSCTPLCKSSPPSIRGTSSSHSASTNKLSSWIMLWLSFHFGTELVNWPTLVLISTPSWSIFTGKSTLHTVWNSE